MSETCCRIAEASIEEQMSDNSPSDWHIGLLESLNKVGEVGPSPPALVDRPLFSGILRSPSELEVGADAHRSGRAILPRLNPDVIFFHVRREMADRRPTNCM